MQGTSASGRGSAFLPPPSGGPPRPAGYVPGRIVPLRLPPPQPQVSLPLSDRDSKQEQEQSALLRKRRRKNTLICFSISLASLFLVLVLVLSLTSADVLNEHCPHHNPSLRSWNPGHHPDAVVMVRRGDLLRLDSSATLNSLTITSGGMIVFADDIVGSKNITLRIRHILIEVGGALHIGAPQCRYRSRATITLLGRSDEAGVAEVQGMGRKFIGVREGGTLELHGAQKLSWTLLSRTIPASGLSAGSEAFQKNFSRGINLRVIDQDSGALLYENRFDTHESSRDSELLHELLGTLPHGRIVAMAVGDSAIKNLQKQTKTAIQELLGSSLVSSLKYRDAWALVSEVRGGNVSCVEDVREHENHNTRGQAVARKEFVTLDGTRFSVTAYSEWRNGFPISGIQVDAVDQVLLHLMDDVHSWTPGDRIVVSSTDYSMYQAEEFTLLPCAHCRPNQVRIQGKPQFMHVGEILDGVDMRAEVALLTRNILIHGEMQTSCYGSNWCQFFSYDTFGGHIKILANHSSVHLSHVELKHMGQQLKGRHPLHFHLCGDVDERGGYSSPTSVQSVSIHHCFSRCVSVQATHGLLIRDTVGYDTLGHCFFLEDGIEQRNTFFHNLGLLTKPGLLLPTERNESMCTSLRSGVYGNYVPVPGAECKAVSTFWIANPNNNLISNAAGGSQDAGIWYVFYSASTGDSRGRVPETRAELTPLGIFYNNRVHSNFKAGLFIDKGVKTSNASAVDPREYLCLDNSARFRPHENSDPKRPRVAALIDTLISFKNNDLGAWIRGGDIVVRNSAFADNGVGLSFASDGSYPKDEGSSQEASNCLFVGESRNRGSNGGQNKYWGVGGVDGKLRTLPRNKTFPIRGFQIYDGPVRLSSSTFRSFSPTAERFSSAIGFSLKNSWQLTPTNNLSSLAFVANVTLRTFFGKPGQWFEDNDLDGDKNSIFHDIDGSVTGYRDTYVARHDNFLIRHPDCVNVSEWNAVVCSGRYSQVYIQTQKAANLSLSISRDEYPEHPMVLRGINSQTAQSQQYQPVLMMGKSYTLHWNGPAPRELVLSLVNFDKGGWVQLGLCYPSDSIFQVVSDIYDRQSSSFDNMQDYSSAPTRLHLQNNPLDRKYYFDRSTGLLWLILNARHGREGNAYCSTKGCERVKVTVSSASQKICNCKNTAYPKHAEVPSVGVPMPPRSNEHCLNCGARQLFFSSDPEHAYLQLQIKSVSLEEHQRGDNNSFLAVDNERFFFNQTGFFVLCVDACSGLISRKSFFPSLDDKMQQYLNQGIPYRSIVLLATRGHLDGLASVAQYLVPLGTAKRADLQGKDSLAFFGFRGPTVPSWAELFRGKSGEPLGLQEKFVPLRLQQYKCIQPSKPQKKDLELLIKALSHA